MKAGLYDCYRSTAHNPSRSYFVDPLASRSRERGGSTSTAFPERNRGVKLRSNLEIEKKKELKEGKGRERENKLVRQKILKLKEV